MNTQLVMSLVSELLWTALLVGAPLLGIPMMVGLGVNLLQVATQVQEMSLSFIPKLATAGLVILIGGPWMLDRLNQFANNLWRQIPHLL